MTGPTNTGTLMIRELDLLHAEIRAGQALAAEQIRAGQQQAAEQIAALRKETGEGNRAVRGDILSLRERVDKIETTDQAMATRADERRRWCRHLIAAQATISVTLGVLAGIASLLGLL